ncbi:mannose-6-phosphate isomerase, class I [Micropruina sonneratiae]|uniref:mannose-6-phosphate isomerase, class I n=1 Tax=Micropruina sonneratiae TaxID=2986940 RepID=UPI002226E41C|nr:mannose-6-phosphate isomerase, class I [Micropruina sp. KQZ13P-5]MCW3158928.1 mannose-6-phosphate isomerase, class I [Micropruina sp. KQZ13P-5]
MQRLSGTVQRYAWGTRDAIPAILGRPADDAPVAEYWLGAHTSSPSLLDDGTLVDHIASGPTVLGKRSREAFGEQLPYLMKLLSARHALSIQAHPSREQAIEGFARESRDGIPLDAPERTYKDSWPKPEIMIALDTFHSLAGFRDPLETAELFTAMGVASELQSVIGPLTERKGPAALAEVFLDVLSLGESRRHLVDEAVSAAMHHRDDDGELGDFARTAIELDAVFPGDPGILAALLMNRIKLAPGEALFVPAGMMHAHLRGTGVEIMANSDNVIRGGLTSKHIDVSELVTVVDFNPWLPEILLPRQTRPGVLKYETPCSEFEAWRMRVDSTTGRVRVPGRGSARIVLAIDGFCVLDNGSSRMELPRGRAAFLAADERDVYAEGTAELYGASSGIR